MLRLALGACVVLVKSYATAGFATKTIGKERDLVAIKCPLTVVAGVVALAISNLTAGRRRGRWATHQIHRGCRMTAQQKQHCENLHDDPFADSKGECPRW
jgi:hypothetical protein